MVPAWQRRQCDLGGPQTLIQSIERVERGGVLRARWIRDRLRVGRRDDAEGRIERTDGELCGTELRGLRGLQGLTLLGRARHDRESEQEE
jgi:hypothetical protein